MSNKDNVFTLHVKFDKVGDVTLNGKVYSTGEIGFCDNIAVINGEKILATKKGEFNMTTELKIKTMKSDCADVFVTGPISGSVTVAHGNLTVGESNGISIDLRDTLDSVGDTMSSVVGTSSRLTEDAIRTIKEVNSDSLKKFGVFDRVKGMKDKLMK